MIDQSHNLKGKIEAMLQTVCMAQELFAKTAMLESQLEYFEAEDEMQEAEGLTP